jgi:uncharacterized protein (DUF488 family)
MARIPELNLPTDSINVQLSNKAAWNRDRSREGADFFTVGYMRRDISAFLDVLLEAGVMTVLDVRHAPVSMYKPDFSKGNLQRHLTGAGIDYVHLRHLGVPRDIRAKAAGQETREPIWEWYDQHVIPFMNLHAFLNSGAHPVALLCMELDPTSCHRHRLAMKLERHGLKGFDL